MKKEAQEYYLRKRQQLLDAADRVVSGEMSPLETIKKVHLTGICGKAMASLAGLLVKAGYEVTGSDNAWNPPMSTVLEHIGIGFHPFDAKNIENIDVLIVGNASAPSNIEATAAREKGGPQLSSAEAYALFFIKGSRSIVVTGTHGKTTTSSLATHVFIESGKETNALVGGVLRNTGESYHFGGLTPDYSVVEGDEYDTAYFDKAPKFLHYKPTIGIITSIEFDHADIYRDMEDYLAAFVFFAQEIPAEGYLLISESVKEEYREKIKEACQCPVYIYGFSDRCDIQGYGVITEHSKKGQGFSVKWNNQEHSGFFLPMFGTYNVENALSVIFIALTEGIPEQYLKDALADFRGSEQRQQILFNDKGIVLIDDFAHHPTAVSVTTKGIRDQYPTQRILAVFEPRSTTSRRKDFEDSYIKAFDAIDIAVIAKPPIKSVDDENKMMDTHKVVEGIKGRISDAIGFSTTDEIVEYLQKTIQANDVVIVMSNGHFDGLSEKLVEYLKKAYDK